MNSSIASTVAAASDANLTVTDVTTNNVSMSAHGFAPKAPGDATKFLNGANPPAWTTPGGTTILTAVTTADFPKTNATLATVTGLSLPLVTGQTYVIEAYLFATFDAGSAQVSLSGTATVTSMIIDVTFPDVDGLSSDGAVRRTALDSAAAPTASYLSPTQVAISITGSIVVNAGGTLTIKFAQGSTNAAASTILAGSWMRAT